MWKERGGMWRGWRGCSWSARHAPASHGRGGPPPARAATRCAVTTAYRLGIVRRDGSTANLGRDDSTSNSEGAPGRQHGNLGGAPGPLHENQGEGDRGRRHEDWTRNRGVGGKREAGKGKVGACPVDAEGGRAGRWRGWRGCSWSARHPPAGRGRGSPPAARAATSAHDSAERNKSAERYVSRAQQRRAGQRVETGLGGRRGGRRGNRQQTYRLPRP
jgi:hypothetical protein